MANPHEHLPWDPSRPQASSASSPSMSSRRRTAHSPAPGSYWSTVLTQNAPVRPPNSSPTTHRQLSTLAPGAAASPRHPTSPTQSSTSSHRRLPPPPPPPPVVASPASGSGVQVSSPLTQHRPNSAAPRLPPTLEPSPHAASSAVSTISPSLPGSHSRSTTRRFPCNQCTRSFERKGHLLEHINSIHNGARPFQCPHCSRQFGHKSSMRRHVAKMHSQPQSSSASSGSAASSSSSQRPTAGSPTNHDRKTARR